MRRRLIRGCRTVPVRSGHLTRGVVAPVRHVVAIHGRVRWRRERPQCPAGVQKLVVEHIGHGPAGAPGRAHQIRLTEPGGHAGDLLVHRVEGADRSRPVQVAHPAILWRPGGRKARRRGEVQRRRNRAHGGRVRNHRWRAWIPRAATILALAEYRPAGAAWCHSPRRRPHVSTADGAPVSSRSRGLRRSREAFRLSPRSRPPAGTRRTPPAWSRR